MKFVYVLENDGRFQRDIVEAIALVDPKIQIRLFGDLTTFMEWVRLAMVDGPSALAKGGQAPERIMLEEADNSETPRLLTILASAEIWGLNQLPLIQKTRDMMIERGFCTKEDPTTFVMTAFDEPSFKIRSYQKAGVANVILKPFDKLILQQHLIHAFDGHHPTSDYKVANIKTSARFEILKDLSMEAVSEIGFVTVGDRSVELGSVCKFYSPMFATAKHKSIVGIVDRIEPHPEAPEKFRIWNRYFSLDATQIKNLRLKIRDRTVTALPGFNYKYKASEPTVKYGCIVIDPDEAEHPQFSDTLVRNIPNIELFHYKNWEEFLIHLDPPKKPATTEEPPPFPARVVAVFMHHLFAGENLPERISKLRELFKKKDSTPEFFLLSTEDYSDEAEREYAKVLTDILYRPIDRSYVLEKLAHVLPSLQNAQPGVQKWIKNHDSFRSANPVQVVEFSEANFVVEYKRPIPIGEFREILLWQPNEVAAPELTAICNCSEASQGKKGIFLNHFVLFGMTDHFLKSIRIWIRNNHILSKAS